MHAQVNAMEVAKLYICPACNVWLLFCLAMHDFGTGRVQAVASIGCRCQAGAAGTCMPAPALQQLLRPSTRFSLGKF